MLEYIEREALLKDIHEAVRFTVARSQKALTNLEIKGANKILDRIKVAPVADVVEVKHGKWIKKNDCAFPVCSECHTWTDELQGTAEFNYCPNCGAKMDGERRSENES